MQRKAQRLKILSPIALNDHINGALCLHELLRQGGNEIC